MANKSFERRNGAGSFTSLNRAVALGLREEQLLRLLRLSRSTRILNLLGGWKSHLSRENCIDRKDNLRYNERPTDMDETQQVFLV